MLSEIEALKINPIVQAPYAFFSFVFIVNTFVPL
jgi:hypothetical protein